MTRTTPPDDLVRACWMDASLSAHEAARKAGYFDRSSMSRRAKAMGLPPRPTGKIKIDSAQLTELWQQGVPTVEIAKRMGVTRRKITDRALYLGLPKRNIHRGAAANTLARVVARNKVIAKLTTAGVTVAATAKQLGCSENTVVYARKALGLSGKRGSGEADPVQHKAIIRMPKTPLKDRADAGDLHAHILRAGDSVVRLGQVAARFRLPYAMVLGLSQRGAG